MQPDRNTTVRLLSTLTAEKIVEHLVGLKEVRTEYVCRAALAMALRAEKIEGGELGFLLLRTTAWLSRRRHLVQIHQHLVLSGGNTTQHHVQLVQALLGGAHSRLHRSRHHPHRL